MTEAYTLGNGELVSGKFRVERVLGEGGMAIVYLATHLQLDEPVALKFLRKDALSRPDIVGRFQREARAAVKLKNEHVARVSDVGEHNGSPYMVMEYLEGLNLEELVQRNGPLPIEEAVEYVIQGCDGISDAHAHHIVHRDLKPANLFLVDRGDGRRVVKVLDFGISKQALTGKISDVDLSKTSATMGSPLYMSPEQIRSTKDVDRRTDVWSLGVVLFELVTGKTPFLGEEFTSLMAEILEQPHRKLSELRPNAPPELELVIDRCLAKDVTKRFQTAAELAVALLAFTKSKRMRVVVQNAVNVTRAAGIDATIRFDSTMPPPPGPGSLPVGLRTSGASATPLEGVTHSTQPDLHKQRARTTRLLVAVGVAALLLAGIGAAFALQGHDKTTELPSPPATPSPASHDTTATTGGTGTGTGAGTMTGTPTAATASVGAVGAPGPASASVASATPSAAASVPPSTTPKPKEPTVKRPPATTPSAAPSSRSPDLDIRRER